MRPAHTALAVLVAAVWGVNFTVIEIGLDHFPPLLFSALRFLAAALPAVFLVGRPKVAWKWIVAVGLTLGVAKFGLLFVSMDVGMPAGLSSLVLQSQAVFTAAIAFAFLGERPTRVRLTGMAVALAGIGVAAWDEGSSGPLGAFALCVAAAVCWGASNVLTRKASPPDSLTFMVWVSTVPVVPLLLLSFLFEGPREDWDVLRSLDWRGAGTVLYVAWVTTVFGFGVWGWLLRRHPASTVAPFSLLVPVFGMSSAALFLDEGVTPPRWLAAALLVGGVALASLTRGERRTDGPVGVAGADAPDGRSPESGADAREDEAGAPGPDGLDGRAARPDADAPDARAAGPGAGDLDGGTARPGSGSDGCGTPPVGSGRRAEG